MVTPFWGATCGWLVLALSDCAAVTMRWLVAGSEPVLACTLRGWCCLDSMLDSVARNFYICVVWLVWLVWLVASVQVLGLLEASADLLSACMGEAVCIALADAGAFASAVSLPSLLLLDSQSTNRR